MTIECGLGDTVLLVKATPRRLGNMSKRHTMGLNLFICHICNGDTHKSCMV
jgi:hypothetical protein